MSDEERAFLWALAQAILDGIAPHDVLAAHKWSHDFTPSTNPGTLREYALRAFQEGSR